jgi:cytoskeleton protein RodZ
MAEKSGASARSMSKSVFGERLKRERELRGVSRNEVCTATRISIRFLEALENEQWGTLPGGIFNRGFVRAVARFLGLDEDDLLAEYDLAMVEQDSSREAPLAPSLPQAPARPRAGRLVWIGAACLIVLLGGGWLVWRSQYTNYSSVGQATSETNTARASVPEAGRPQETAPGTSAENAAGTASAAPLAASTSAPSPDSQGLKLKIEAGKETSVSVSADGSKVFEGSMIAGQSRTFTAQEAIDISAKDGGALLLELNGQTLALLGPPGQPGNVTLTRNDLKPSGGGAD